MPYSEKQKTEIINFICKEIEEGKSLRSILRDNDGMPGRNTFFEWIDSSKEMANQYARAMDARAELIFEDILNIADENGRDIRYTEDGEFVDHDVINRAKLRVDTRKWMLGRMNPKKYGDKSTTVLEGGEKDIKISFNEADN